MKMPLLRMKLMVKPDSLRKNTYIMKDRVKGQGRASVKMSRAANNLGA